MKNIIAEMGRLPSITKKMTDESNDRQFQFTFYCDTCGKAFQTSIIPFSGASDNDISFEKRSPYIKSLIWYSEYEDAFERSNKEALIRFNYCNACGKYFCSDCAGDIIVDTICLKCKKSAFDR